MVFINLEIEELDTNHSLSGLTTNSVANPFSPSLLSSRCRWYLSLGLINPFPKTRSWYPAFRSIQSHLHRGQWRSEELFLVAFWFHQCRSNIKFIFEPRAHHFKNIIVHSENWCSPLDTTYGRVPSNSRRKKGMPEWWDLGPTSTTAIAGWKNGSGHSAWRGNGLSRTKGTSVSLFRNPPLEIARY